MGRLRRSRRWTAILGATVILGVALHGVAAAQTDPPTTTAPPASTAAPATTAPPDTAPPPTTTPAAPPSGGSSDARGQVGATATPGGGIGGASPGGTVGAAAAPVDVADLGVTNSDSPDPVTAGGNVTYTITMTNAGPSDAVNAHLQDPVSGIATFVSVNQDSGPAATCNFPAVGSGGTVNCFIDPFPAGATAVFTLVVHVDLSAPAGSTVINPATVSSQTTDANSTNNAATATTTVQAAQADLALTKTDTPDPVTPNGNITYTITATNLGPSDSTSVNLQDAMPFNTTFVSLTPPAGWSCTTPSVGSAGLAQCSIGLLANGATATFTLVVHVSPSAANGSTITNSAFINNQGTADPNALNNTASAQTLVQSADLSVTKTDNLDPVPSGTNLTYTITVTNNGPAVAQTPNLADTVPGNTTFVSLTPPAGWACGTPPSGGTGSISCGASSLASGASAVFTLVVHVDAGAADGTVITNTASANSATGDANPANNSATQTTTVGSTADVAVTKTAPATVPSESDLSYSITATNNGPSPAQNVTLTDTVPAGTTFVSLTVPAGWVCNTPAPGGTGTISCTTTTFAAGAPAAFTLVVFVPGDPTGFISNTATVSSTTNDQNATNNTATANTSIVNPVADVTITKTDSPDPVTAGTNLTYTITAINNGPSTAHNVVVTDSPSTGGLTFVSATASQGTCTGTSTITCSLGSLANGASVTITLVKHVGPHFAAGTVLSNTADISENPTPDPNPNNDEATATTTVVTSADIAVTKTASSSQVTPGSNVTYTVTVKDNGPSNADATWTDALPAGTTFVSLEQTTGTGFTCTEPAVGTGGTISCSLSILSAGETATFVVVVTVDPGTAPGTQIVNTASESSTTSDPDASNNSASATTTVATAADLAVTKTDNPDPVTAGTDLTYTIGVTNAGPSDAQGVTLGDPIPAGTTFVSAVPSQGTCVATTTLTCNLGTVANGASATVTLTVHVGSGLAPGTTLTNTATASSGTTDPNPANDSATATTTVATAADLAVTKTDNPDPVTAGTDLTYTIGVTNAGPSDAQGVTLGDPIAVGTTLVSVVPSQGSCTGTTAVSCNLGAVASGASATITLVVHVDPASPAGSTITNTATASSATTDPNPANDSAIATTTVATSADLAMTKTGSPDPVEPGGDLTYTITITNNGPSAAQNVTMSDSAPAGTTLQDFESGPGPAAGCTLGTADVSCNYATFPAGASVVLTMVVTVEPSVVPGTVISNTAAVTSGEVSVATADPNPGNNSATATTTVASPEVPGEGPGEAPATPAPASPASPATAGGSTETGTAATAAVAVIAVPRFTG